MTEKSHLERLYETFLYLFVLNDNTMQRLQLYAMSTKEFAQEYFATTEMCGIAMHGLEYLAKGHVKSESYFVAFANLCRKLSIMWYVAEVKSRVRRLTIYVKPCYSDLYFGTEVGYL